MADAAEPETLVLRFRDLATEPGETIAQHHGICAQHGRVLWGWWHKAREKVPRRVFEAMRTKAAADEPKIYLLNAAERKLYRARLSDVHFDESLEAIHTPDPALTPDYYQGRRCRAWFELRQLELAPVPFAPLAGLLQVAVADFFEGGVPPELAAYDGTVLHSPEHLDEQNRTVWFARAPTTADTSVREADAPRPRARLRSGPATAVGDFPREHLLTEGRRLLWLSDLHFAEGEHRHHHGFAYQNDGRPDRSPLHQELEWLLDRHGVLSDVEGLIISGDITWKAAAEEFRQARTFIRELIAKTGKADRPERVALCPGNHDLRFSAEPWAKGRPIEHAGAKARGEFVRFWTQLFGEPDNEFLCMGRRFLLAGAVPVEIVCLNSSLLQQEAGVFQGHGFIGDGQLHCASEGAGWVTRGRGRDTRPRAVRIAVLHHHLLPVIHQLSPERSAQYSTPLDAERLARWVVRNRVDLVLHGHMHEPFCVEVTRGETVTTPREDWHTFTVCGLGSTGVDDSHRAGPNLAATLCFDHHRVTIEMFELSSDGSLREKHAQFEVPLRGHR